MKNPENSIQNFTNSGLEQVSFNKGDIIYQFNEQPKFAYFVYTGSINIISKNGYNLGVIGEGELFGEVSSLFNKDHSVSAEAATECRLLIMKKIFFIIKYKVQTLF